MQTLLMEPFRHAYMQRALAELLLLSVMGTVVGVHVVLRRLAFLTDALQHTVFPGIVIAFLLGQSLLVGALAAAVLTVTLFTLVSRRPDVDQDAALALLISGFFALGVVMVSRSGGYQHDLTTLLFGRVLAVDTRQVVETAALAIVVVFLLTMLHKELIFRAFDETGSAAAGYSVAVIDFVLNLLVALVVVAAVRAVGTVLLVAFIVTPAATAKVVLGRVSLMMVMGVAVAAAAAWVGLGVSYKLSLDNDVDVAAGATVVACSTVLFTAGVLVHMAGRVWSRMRSS